MCAIARAGGLPTVASMSDGDTSTDPTSPDDPGEDRAGDPDAAAGAPLMARPKQAATLFGVSAKHLRELERRDSRFPRPYRTPGVVLYDVAALLAYFSAPPSEPEMSELTATPTGTLPMAAIPESLRPKRTGRGERRRRAVAGAVA